MRISNKASQVLTPVRSRYVLTSATEVSAYGRRDMEDGYLSGRGAVDRCALVFRKRKQIDADIIRWRRSSGDGSENLEVGISSQIEFPSGNLAIACWAESSECKERIGIC